jgi:hypothetical protein
MLADARESLLTRARARRARLCDDGPEYAPAPAPALELVIRFVIQPSWIPVFYGSFPLDYLFMSSIDMAYWAEYLALDSGVLRDRLLADEALSFAVRVAGRIINRKEGRPCPRPPGNPS